ncbi:Uncharacterised protein [Moraxella lacunata]|uniref:Uncharacterized protein n=1 Tax=Moraxella lacunata TaxID=477 RepID=A0A378T7C1_MORLA|nr:hypothetical protein [Moraxella lacunata]STZ56027.1 Uncharacterised protein [Moraxella lacunata]
MDILPYFENINELNEYLTLFPDSDKLFVEHQSWLKEHFLPLISIDLGMLNDDWRGQVVHMLNPFEPDDGYIGECTHEYHNEFTGENWFAFKLTNDNRYEFLGDEKYFLRAHDCKNPDGSYDDNLEQIADYQKQKALFKEHGFIVNANFPKHLDKDWNKESFLDELGGGFSYGNWANYDTPSAFHKTRLKQVDDDTPNDGISITYEGNPFYFIGGVPSYHYCTGFGGAYIMMMYEPVSRIVLFTFDYS